MKTTLDLRPIFHRREDRIRAHVLLCWLSLLLIRIAENATGETWRTIRTELDKLHLGRFAGPAGEVSSPPRLPARVTHHAPPTRPIGTGASSSCGIPD